VVFDIDGTLTPTPFQFWRVRSDAAETAQYYADQGVEIIYLTARTSLLQWHIPGWLERNDFPPGSLFTIQTNADRDDHEQFKTRILQQLIARGWNIELAFGDSSTDFQSYANVGISRLRVFALRRHGDDGCQPGIWARCLTGWSEYLQSPISLAR
jgi:phosphatidate phosphatase PAH1